MSKRERRERSGPNDDGERLTEYEMPLAGSSSGSVGDPASATRVSIDMDGAEFGSPSFGDGGKNGRPKNRRGSNLTDATPRFQNYSTEAGRDDHNIHQQSGSSQFSLPPLPDYESNNESGGSVYSPSNNNATSVHSAGEGAPSYYDDDEEDYEYEGNSVSQSADSYNSPSNPSYTSTPIANRRSSMYEMKGRRSTNAMQISFDGRIRELPLSHDNDDQEQNCSTSSNHTPDPARPRGKSVDSIPSVTSNHSQRSIDIEDDISEQDSQNEVHSLVWCGFPVPMCIARALQRPPSLSRISLFLVTIAPCFWCCGKSLQGVSTDRAVLTRLNILALFFAFFQVVAGMWLVVVLLILDDQEGALGGFAPHLWNLNGNAFSIGIIGFVCIVTCTCTIRVIKEVDLVGAIRHLWILLWLLPFESFFSISLFDYFRVTEVWIKHWWLQPHLSWFRDYFCEEGTSSTLCLVPLDGGPDYATEDEWCQANYQSDSCTEIRDDAQDRMTSSMLLFYTCLASWSILMLALMLLMLRSLEKIISKPIVQKSRESNVPAWLTLPTAGTALVGSILLYSPTSLLSASSGTDNSWIGVAYLISAGLFFLAMILGWFLSAFSIRSSLDKKYKSVAVIIFIITMAAAAIIQIAILGASVVFAGNLVQAPIDDSQRGEVACFVDKDTTCTNCDDPVPENRCPEWTLDDVTRILQTQLKQSATLAAIFVLYAISALQFGLVLRKHLSLYQIDYV